MVSEIWYCFRFVYSFLRWVILRHHHGELTRYSLVSTRGHHFPIMILFQTWLSLASLTPFCRWQECLNHRETDYLTSDDDNGKNTNADPSFPSRTTDRKWPLECNFEDNATWLFCTLLSSYLSSYGNWSLICGMAIRTCTAKRIRLKKSQGTLSYFRLIVSFDHDSSMVSPSTAWISIVLNFKESLTSSSAVNCIIRFVRIGLKHYVNLFFSTFFFLFGPITSYHDSARMRARVACERRLWLARRPHDEVLSMPPGPASAGRAVRAGWRWHSVYARVNHYSSTRRNPADWPTASASRAATPLYESD